MNKQAFVPGGIAFLITAGLLTVVKLQAPYRMLLADRFFDGAGWIEIVLLAAYAALISATMINNSDNSKIRLRIWLAFSIVFFGQFILGVSGIDRLLMTGSLHIPVPAVVIAGPLFRGERFFMPILFLSTIVFVGPAWCSHLCYIGAWDGLAASRRKRATTISPAWTIVRISIFVLTPVAALVLRAAGVPDMRAAWFGIIFGILSLGVMALISTRRGTMVHCTSICPLGFVGNILGKISPFRLRIAESCNNCGKCISTCRYNALSSQRIAARKPGYTCTLCGDCLPSCKDSALGYRFFKLSPRTSRAIFLVTIVSLHAVFLGVARI